jgi:hypothetical protein
VLGFGNLKIDFFKFDNNVDSFRKLPFGFVQKYFWKSSKLADVEDINRGE